MRKISLVCLVLILALASACGYAFRGGQNNLPPDIRTIAIPVFKNATSELRIETIITDEVIFQFTRSQALRVVDQAEADAVFYGTIVKVDIKDVAYTSGQTSRQRRVTITVRGRLVRRLGGAILWQDPAMEEFRTYTVTASPVADEAAKQVAVTALARTMAQTLHDRVLENF